MKNYHINRQAIFQISTQKVGFAPCMVISVAQANRHLNAEVCNALDINLVEIKSVESVRCFDLSIENRRTSKTIKT